MPTPLRRLSATVLPVLGALALASCGGGGGSTDVQQVLNTAFKENVKSANLKLDAELDLKGAAALSKPIRLSATGPYIVNKGKLPSADLNVSIEGGGQTIQTGFVSTGDRSFVKFQDVFYEQPRSQVASANADIKKGAGNTRSSLKALGLNPRGWLKDSKDKGEETVAGVTANHISGKLDVRRLLEDFNGFVKRSGASDAPQALSSGQLAKVADVVKDPTFDVYVGKDDHIIRRISGRLDANLPQGTAGGQLQGLKGGSLKFSFELSKVNGDQKVTAPTSARPLSALTSSLGAGALGALGAGGGSTGGNTGDTSPPSSTPSGPSSDAFKKYADCLDKAKSSNTDALQRCSDLLAK